MQCDKYSVCNNHCFSYDLIQLKFDRRRGGEKMWPEARIHIPYPTYSMIHVTETAQSLPWLPLFSSVIFKIIIINKYQYIL